MSWPKGRSASAATLEAMRQGRLARSTCNRGHRWDEGNNTRYDAAGYRRCRRCQNESSKNQYRLRIGLFECAECGETFRNEEAFHRHRTRDDRCLTVDEMYAVGLAVRSGRAKARKWYVRRCLFCGQLAPITPLWASRTCSREHHNQYMRRWNRRRLIHDREFQS